MYFCAYYWMDFSQDPMTLGNKQHMFFIECLLRLQISTERFSSFPLFSIRSALTWHFEQGKRCKSSAKIWAVLAYIRKKQYLCRKFATSRLEIGNWKANHIIN